MTAFDSKLDRFLQIGLRLFLCLFIATMPGATLRPIVYERVAPPIPDDVREQVRKQVRLSVAEHASGHLDSLADILHSGYAQIYLFQVAEPLDTQSELTGDRCGLASGDLLVMTTAFPRSGDEATLEFVTVPV